LLVLLCLLSFSPSLYLSISLLLSHSLAVCVCVCVRVRVLLRMVRSGPKILKMGFIRHEINRLTTTKNAQIQEYLACCVLLRHLGLHHFLCPLLGCEFVCDGVCIAQGGFLPVWLVRPGVWCPACVPRRRALQRPTARRSPVTTCDRIWFPRWTCG